MAENPYAAPQAELARPLRTPGAPGISPYGPYRELTGLARTLLVLLSLGIVAAAGQIYVILAVTEANLLYENDTQVEATVDRWVNLSARINLIEGLIRIVTIIVWCLWTNKSCKNAWLIRATTRDSKSPEFTPGWAVGWYFIPILNLWKPYQVMAFMRDQVAPYFKGGPILGAWWASWIVLTFASAYFGRDQDLGTMEAVHHYNQGLIIDSGIGIVAAVLAGVVILTMTSAQQRAAADLDLRGKPA